MTVTITQNEAQLIHGCDTNFWHNPTAPWCTCLILARYLQLSWQKIECCILLAVQLVALQVLRHWLKNNGPVCKVSTICWIYLQFPVTWLQQLLVFAVCGCIAVLKDHTLWQMFMSLPASSLMHSARHVTTYVHILCWVSKYEYTADEYCST